MKTIYICGPVSGRNYEEAKAEFDMAAYKIKYHYIDKEPVQVVNPFDFCQKGEDWNHAMRKCIARLVMCDYIHCLLGFHKSEGARLEMTIAEKLHMGICNDIFELCDYEEGDK